MRQTTFAEVISDGVLSTGPVFFRDGINRRDFSMPVELPEPWSRTLSKLSLTRRFQDNQCFDPLV